MNIEQRVHGDDRGYLTWAAAHPVGYVINVQRNLNPSDARLHRADCYTINSQPARGKSWTGPARPVPPCWRMGLWLLVHKGLRRLSPSRV